VYLEIGRSFEVRASSDPETLNKASTLIELPIEHGSHFHLT
jgi:hypothetical protein